MRRQWQVMVVLLTVTTPLAFIVNCPAAWKLILLPSSMFAKPLRHQLSQLRMVVKNARHQRGALLATGSRARLCCAGGGRPTDPRRWHVDSLVRQLGLSRRALYPAGSRRAVKRESTLAVLLAGSAWQ